MEQVASGVEALGIVTIVVGLAVALVQAARLQVGGDGGAGAYRAVRTVFGRSILLAADIIRTVAVEPSLENVGVLGLIVLIRTLLSFSLEVEIDGTWPWRRAAGRARCPATRSEARGPAAPTRRASLSWRYANDRHHLSAGAAGQSAAGGDRRGDPGPSGCGGGGGDRVGEDDPVAEDLPGDGARGCPDDRAHPAAAAGCPDGG